MTNNEHAERLLEMAKEEQRSLDQAGDSGGWIIGFTEAYRDRLEALRAGAAALREANRWRPIAEAPRGGTQIDLWTADGERFTDCEWMRGCWRRQLQSGWVPLFSEITHFRPIPDPPEAPDAR